MAFLAWHSARPTVTSGSNRPTSVSSRFPREVVMVTSQGSRPGLDTRVLRPLHALRG